MQLENTFTIPTGIEEAWAAFNDPQRFAPCFPGATLESSDADGFTGTVKVKLGPISLSYKGKGTYVERDEDNYKVLIDASGRDARGNGTASAKVTGKLEADGPEQTKVTMLTEMTVTGRPAQFGRGVMADVSDKIIGQFASCLSNKLGSSGAGGAPASSSPAASSPGSSPVASSSGAAATGAAGPAGAGAAAGSSAVSTEAPAPTTPSTNGSAPALATAPDPAQSEVEAIDLLGSAGAPVLKRVGPAVVALLLLFIVIRRLKGRG